MLKPLGSDGHPLFTFKRERLSNDCHRQDAEFFCNFGNNWRTTCPGTTTHTGGDKYHIGTLQSFCNAFAVFQSRFTSHIRICTGTQTFGQTVAQLDHGTSAIITQSLRIGIRTDEVNAINLTLHHMLYSITAAAANTDYFNYCVLLNFICKLEHITFSDVRHKIISFSAGLY